MCWVLEPGLSFVKQLNSVDSISLGSTLPHISLVLEIMFRGSTNGSSSSEDDHHGAVHGDTGYVTHNEFVGLRHLVRDGLGRYERRLQAQEANFNERILAQEENLNEKMARVRDALNNLAQRRSSSSSRTRSDSRSTQPRHAYHDHH